MKSILQNKHKTKYEKSTYIILIIFLTILAYSSTWKNQILNWDDDKQIVNNNDIKDIKITNINKLFTTYYLNMYQPLTSLSYALEYKFAGLNPKIYHIDNLILHLSNILLVFYFIYVLTGIKQKEEAFFNSKYIFKQSDTRTQISAIVALIFAIHPMNVETVSWISTRSTLLFTFFFISGMITYMIYFTNNKNKYYAYTLILFILSLLSKPAAVCFPLALIVIDYYLTYSSKSIKIRSEHIKNKKKEQVTQSYKLIINKLPLLILSIIFGLLSINSHKEAITYLAPSFSILDKIILVSYSATYYIIKLFIPTGLCLFHYYIAKTTGFFPIEYYLSFIFWVIFLAFIIFNKSFPFKRDLIFCLSFYIVAIVLVLQMFLYSEEITAERYAYLPYIGLIFGLVKIYFNFINNKTYKTNHISYIIRILFIVIVLILSITSYERTKVWENNISLYNDVLKKYPKSFEAYNNRGNAKSEIGDKKGSIEDYSNAIKIRPKVPYVYYNRGKVKDDINDHKGAIIDYSKAIELKPDYYEAYTARALDYYILSNYDKAVNDYNKAISINQNEPLNYDNIGYCYYEKKEYDKALQNFKICLKLEYNNIDAIIGTSVSYYQINMMDSSNIFLEKAKKLRPELNKGIEGLEDLKKEGIDFPDNIKNILKNMLQ